jgi:hypothetical protein
MVVRTISVKLVGLERQLVSHKTTMTRTFITASLIQLALCPQASLGALSISDGLVCDNVGLETSSFEVCSITYLQSPLPAELNGTNEYTGSYINDYLIYRSFPNATGSLLTDVAEYNAGYRIRVERNTSDACLGVWINQVNCGSCMYCGDEAYSANCTNLKFGRDVMCENAASVFFPLTAEALEIDEPMAAPPVMSPTLVGTPPDKVDEPSSGSNRCFEAARS